MVSTPKIATPYEFLKACFDEIETCKPDDRKPILLGHAAQWEHRESLTAMRAIDSCIKAAKRHNASQELLDELAGLYGYAKAEVQR